jgi:hypothetical protein
MGGSNNVVERKVRFMISEIKTAALSLEGLDFLKAMRWVLMRFLCEM